jgi:hypothetical protein
MPASLSRWTWSTAPNRDVCWDSEMRRDASFADTRQLSDASSAAVVVPNEDRVARLSRDSQVVWAVICGRCSSSSINKARSCRRPSATSASQKPLLCLLTNNALVVSIGSDSGSPGVTAASIVAGQSSYTCLKTSPIR